MLITIITINYNNREGLARTLESVRMQTSKEFEYIVIDGGSDDGSRELIEDNQDIIDSWVSERDKGIYNAMNKGVERAHGEYSLFLNSGDVLHDPKVMQRVLDSNLSADIVFGRVQNCFPDGKTELYVPAEEMSLMWIIRTGIHHAGSFIRNSLMRKHPYDEKFRICSDRKFFVEALVIDNCTMQNLDFTVCDFEIGGISSSAKDVAKQEYWQIMDELFPPRVVSDYRKSDERIQRMTGELVRCRYRIISLICGLDIFIIKIFKLILGNKIFRS